MSEVSGELRRYRDSIVERSSVHEDELVRFDRLDTSADPRGGLHGQRRTPGDKGPAVKVRVQQRVFKCPRKALAASSEYFKAGLAEVGEDEVLSTPDEVTEDSFLKAFDFMYGMHLKFASDEVPQVMAVASSLKMKNLWKLCQNFHVERIPPPLTRENVDQWFQWESLYDAMKIEIGFHSRARKISFGTPSPLDGLSPSEMTGVLKSDWLRAHSEDDVIKTLVTWVRAFEEVPLLDLQPMMQRVRLPLARLATQEARFLAEKAGMYEWVLEEAQEFLAAPHLQQKFSTRRVLRRFGFTLDAVIFVVGSRVDVSLDGHSYTHRPWDVFAFSLREQLWYEPHFQELRSGGKPLLDDLQRTGSFPVACSHGNGFFVTSLAEDMPLVHVDVVHCSDRQLRGIPHANQIGQNQEGQTVQTKPPFTDDLTLRASKHELIASGRSLDFQTHYFSMKVRRWFLTTEEEPGTLQSAVETWGRLDQAAQTYGQLYGFSKISVKVVLLDDDVIVVDQRGNVSKWEGGSSFATIAAIPNFHGRESFGVALAGSVIYVMGGIIRFSTGNVSITSDVICVEVQRHPTRVRKLTSAIPCPLVHSAFRLNVKKICFKGRQVEPRESLKD